MDLFKKIVSHSELHHNFKVIENDESVITVINKWADGFIDRDNKFAKEFQTTFNSSFWELYLHALLKSLEFKIDFSYNRPDFCSSKNGQDVIIEAVITSNPAKGTPEYDKLEALLNLAKLKPNEIDDAYRELTNLSAERILNSISSKHKLYCNSYKELAHVKNKPFVLAIGAFEQPFFHYQGMTGILKALYGLESAKYVNGVESFEYQEQLIKKSNGAEIPIGLFTDNRMKEISAIIFNPIASIGKVRALAEKKKKNCFVMTKRYNDYGTAAIIDEVPLSMHEESLQDGVQIYVNPFAENKIDIELLYHDDFAIHYTEDDISIKHGFLYARSLESFTFESNTGHKKSSLKAKKKIQKNSRKANRK